MTITRSQQKIRKRFRGRARFRIVGTDRTGYKLIAKAYKAKTYKELKAMEDTLERVFNVEYVIFELPHSEQMKL